MTKKILYSACLIILGIFTFSCTPAVDPFAETQASIKSFVLTTANNPTLSADVVGIINPTTKVITLKIETAVSDYTTIKPTISFNGEATIYPASDEVKDFTQNPVTYKLTDKSGHTEVYYAKIVPKPVDAPVGAIRITEYFCGTGAGSATTGELNRYIELYNDAAVSVDLSQFELVQKRAKFGVVDPKLDQMATLKGTIPSKSYFIIYSAKMNTSLLANVNAWASKQSDAIFNGIMDSDGASSYQLQKNGEIIDIVGPNDGSFFAKNTCYLRRTDLGTGIPLAASSVWDASSWAVIPISGVMGNDANAGKASATDSALISLLFISGNMTIPATVDPVTKYAVALLPDGIPTNELTVAAGTFGTKITVDGNNLVNNQTVLDLTSQKTLIVTGQDGSTTSYFVSVAPRYTNINYLFDGGIKAVMDKLWLKPTGEDVALGDVEVTGILTAKGIYPAAFVIQDSTAGLYFYTSEGISFPLGSKVKIKVSTGKVYNGLPEVTVYDSTIEAVDSNLYSLYYKTGDFANKDAVGLLYKYTGSIAQNGLASYKGQFTGAYYFHYLDKTIQSLMGVGTSGTFYGPITYVASNYTMELSSAEQINKQ